MLLYATYLVVLIWASNLVHYIVLMCVKVLIAPLAELMLVRILFVVYHVFFGVEGHLAVFERALEAPNGLKFGRHLVSRWPFAVI